MRIKLSIGALVALMSFSLSAGAAIADEYAVGGTDSGYKPDNGDHTYCWNTTFAESQNAKDASNYALNNLDNQTTMYETFISSGCTTITDARWIKTTNSGDGYYQCLGFNSAGECETAHVAINFSNQSSWTDWKNTACHETGHSVGLTHGNYDCMGTDVSPVQYSDHHVDHVNNDR
jgi:hypothetical protein